MSRTWDVVVVGGGTAGIVSAKTAGGFGARVLLVERARTGGDCLWTGCVPSKSLLAAAAAAAGARAGERLGVHVQEPRVDFAGVLRHVHGAIATIEPVDSPQALEEAGVTVTHGDFAFTGPQEGVVEGRPVRFGQAIVCTGSSPVLPPIPGLDQTSALTSDTVWDLAELPRRLVVLGGGGIGCELAQAFARLGSEVTVVEASEGIMGPEDPRAAELVVAALERDGVCIRTGATATGVRPDGTAGTLVLQDGTELDYDRLLVSVGRRPGTAGLGLERAGVETDDGGYVRVDARLRSTHPRVWAAGDVTGHDQFTHVAGVHGSVAATNAVLGLRRRVETSTVPRVTYTHPEVAAVGVGTSAATPENGLRCVTVGHEHLDRAVAESDVHGFTTLVVDRRGRVVGGTVVGPRAGESLGELTLAVRHGMRTRDLAGTTHAYPTYTSAVWEAGIRDVRARLRRPAASAAIRVGSAVRRGWVRAAVRTGPGSRRPRVGRH